MLTPLPMFDELAKKLREIAETSPLRDFEKNAKLLLGSMFERLDLVTRDEFDALRESVQHLRTEVARLHERLAGLEVKQSRQEHEEN